MDSVINIISNISGKGEISQSNKNRIFKILIIVGLVLAIFTYLFPTNYAFVITLILFALWVANYYSTYTDNSITTTNNRIMYHLNVLQEITNTYIDKKLKDPKRQFKLSKNDYDIIYKNNKLSYLYIDSNLIEFLYSIKILSEWNDNEFYLLLKGTNNILKLRNDIEEYYQANKKYPDNIFEIFEQSLILRSNTINNLHRFIYSVPKNNMMYNYTNKIIDRYMVLISRNTDKIYYYIQDHIKTTGINSSTKFISYNTTRPYDSSQKYDFYT
jgi:hypothetical protein